MKARFDYTLDFRRESNQYHRQCWYIRWNGMFLFATTTRFLNEIDHQETSYIVRFFQQKIVVDTKTSPVYK